MSRIVQPSYLVACLSVVVAWGLQAALGPRFGPIFAFAPFLMAATVAAWVGGLRPTLFALVLGYLISVYFYVNRGRFLVTGGDELAALSVYVLVGLSTGILSELFHVQVRKVEAAHERLRTTLASIGDAVIATDAEGRVTILNKVAERLTGWSSKEAVGKQLSEVFAVIDERTGQPSENPITRVMESGLIVGLADHTVLAGRDGLQRPIRDSAAPIRTADGEITGVVLVFRDASVERNVEVAEEALRASEERLRLALSAGNMGVWDWDVPKNRLTWTERIYVIHGVDDTAFGGTVEDFQRQIYPEDKPRVEEAIHQTLEDASPYNIEFRIVRPTGEIRWVWTSGRVLQDTDGRPVRMLGATIDITERKWAEETQQFLAAVGEALSELTDYETTMRNIARQAIVSFADMCLVYMVSAQGHIERVAATHLSQTAGRLLDELNERYPLHWNSTSPAARVLRDGVAEFVADIPDSFLSQLAVDEEHLELVKRLGLRSFICVPLVVRNKPIGCIAFLTAERRPAYGEEDLQIATEIARRAAIAIDNTILYREVREAARQKDEFLAMLAHELRNPLAALQYTNQIAKTPGLMSPEEITEIIDRQIGSLTHLIDDLLDVSRISRDKIELKRERLDGALVAKRALGTIRPMIEERHHQLVTDLEEKRTPLYADPTRLEQILTNLLSNAAKYTPEGGTIWLTANREGDQAVFRVRDTGIGIKKEMLPRVFELFLQVDRSLDRSQGGLGIGLTVVRKLVELHGGRVSVASEGLGEGSEFTVRLPLAKSEAEPERPCAIGHQRSRKFRILVVDDNADVARGMAIFLQSFGHSVEVAHDGKTGLRVAREHQPEVFILDIGLPGMDGYELVHRLRTSGFNESHFVAISGYGQPQDQDRAKQAGFDEHLVKPIEHEKLLAALR